MHRWYVVRAAANVGLPKQSVLKESGKRIIDDFPLRSEQSSSHIADGAERKLLLLLLLLSQRRTELRTNHSRCICRLSQPLLTGVDGLSVFRLVLVLVLQFLPVHTPHCTLGFLFSVTFEVTKMRPLCHLRFTASDASSVPVACSAR